LTAVSAANTNGTYAFTYDDDGRITKVTEPYGLTLNFAYDLLNNQLTETDNFGTQTSKFDNDGFLTERIYQGQSQTLRSDFTYNREGWTTDQKDFSTTAGTTYVADIATGYDNIGNVTSILATNYSSATVDQFKYAYDSADRLTSETDTQNSATTTTSYTYDAAGQLLTATSATTLTYVCRTELWS